MMRGVDTQLRGGQVWRQTDFPFMSRYVAYLDLNLWALLSMPDRQGSMACSDESGQWLWTTADAEAHLLKHGYALVGQFVDVNIGAITLERVCTELRDVMAERDALKAQRDEARRLAERGRDHEHMLSVVHPDYLSLEEYRKLNPLPWESHP